MPLEKCEYCRARIRPNLMPLHLKKCIQARRARKRGIISIEIVNPEDIQLHPGFTQALLVDKGKKKTKKKVKK
jgi:hypothetical protein